MSLAFPEIITDKPVGTQMVSTIDDFERETRTWLRQCMIEISGYPDVETVSVKGWTTSTRPKSNPNSNYLLGYNTQTKSLELIGTNGAVIEVLSDDTKKSIALLAHPVGEYFWTSNASFNPNTAWGGTWERIQDGRCLISNNGSHAVGSTGGSETVTLSLSQIPSHSHPHTHNHTHGRGTMNITGKFYLNRSASVGQGVGAAQGAFSFGDKVSARRCDDSAGDELQYVNLDASRSWTGRTTEDSTAASYHAQGGGGSHNNMQPFRTAICWHRTK